MIVDPVSIASVHLRGPMSPILVGIVIAFALGASSMVLFIASIVTRRFSLLYAALATLALAGLSGTYAAYLLANRAIDEVRALTSPRSGEELYGTLFGTPAPGSVHVIAHEDALLPELDDTIFLRVTTTAAELRRVLGTAEYTFDGTMLDPDRDSGHFDTGSLGADHIGLHATISEGRQWRSLYFSADSTDLIVVDVSDP
jgi:hypothetical protein